MAETGSRVTREQKVQMARKALEDANAGRFSADGWAQDAVFRSPLLGEVKGREAIIAALKRQRDAFEEFSQEAHAVLADDDHVVALVNVNARSKGQDVKAQQVIVIHTTDQGQIKEFWSMFDTDALKKIGR